MKKILPASSDISKPLFNYVLAFFLLTLFSSCSKDQLPVPEKGAKKQGELEVKIHCEDGPAIFILDIKGVGEMEVSTEQKQSFFLEKGTYELELKGMGPDFMVVGENPRTIEVLSKKKVKVDFKVVKNLSGNVQEQIIFSSNRTGNFEVFAMHVDGTNARQLTHFDDEYNYPRKPEVSRDGKKVVFTVAGYIYVMDVDGSNLQQLTSDPDNYDTDPSWSKDGSQIVFGRIDDTELESIYIMNANGTDARQISNYGEYVIMPNMSPDGSTVVFVHDTNSPEGAIIFKVLSDGTNSNILIDYAFNNYDPKWSPDGTKILFTGWPFDGEVRQIFVANADGTGIQQITTDELSKTSVNWSYDGTAIVYSVSEMDGSSNIYSIDADGSNIAKLTDTPYIDLFPSWGPVPAGGGLLQ